MSEDDRNRGTVRAGMLAGTGLIVLLSLWQHGIRPGTEIVFAGALVVFLVGFTRLIPREVPERD